MPENIAFKCTYNDGGQAEQIIGFAGTCTAQTIISNVKAGGGRWCSAGDNECRAYFERGFRGRRPVNPCYESELFTEWCFGSGVDNTADRHGIPRHPHRTGDGKIAFLTTRLPGSVEDERRIIGLFKIDSMERPFETIVYADERLRIRLPKDVAEQLYFWDYYRNSNTPEAKWGNGLFRYLSDGLAARILDDVMTALEDSELKRIAAEMRAEIWGAKPASKQKGPHSSGQRPMGERVGMAGKYFGGEGEKHRKLKEWLARHPEHLGYTDVKTSKTEYGFKSFDCVDVFFERKDGSVVVAEVETYWPEPGAYQAIKYRALALAEKRLPLNSDKVETWLVSCSLSDEVKALCDFYGVRYALFPPGKR